MKEKENLDVYFRGEKLYGDDFNLKQIKEWYNDEKEGYSGLDLANDSTYGFYRINYLNGFNKIKSVKEFNHVLSFGGAKGEELNPIINKTKEVYIIEPSQKLRVKSISGKPVRYVTPMPSGKIDFKDNYFDLITCFGTLHHIPNVSFVLKELFRVLKPGGYLLLREPIVSMGDWRKPRRGLTKRERGIPLGVFRKVIKENNVQIVSERKILFPLLRRIDFGRYKGGNSNFWVNLDYILGILFSWNNKYHSKGYLDKIRPQSVFYVLKKN